MVASISVAITIIFPESCGAVMAMQRYPRTVVDRMINEIGRWYPEVLSLDPLAGAQCIDLDDPRTISGLQMMRAPELLAPGWVSSRDPRR